MSESKAAGLLPGYETTYVTRPEMSDDAMKTLRERLEKVIAAFDGEVVQFDDWGKRKMAYTIKKESRGHYSFFAYTGKPGVVQELERNLRLQEHVLRFLSVNLETEFNKENYNKDFIPFSRRIKKEVGDRGFDRAFDRSDRGDRGGYGGGGYGGGYDRYDE